jgi:hypothetical protein
VGGNCSSCCWPVAGNDIQDAGWETGFFGKSSNVESRQRSLLCWLKNDSAASCDGWPPLPREHENRVVPRDDLANDPNRFFACVTQEVSVDWNCVAVDLVSVAGIITGEEIKNISLMNL